MERVMRVIFCLRGTNMSFRDGAQVSANADEEGSSGKGGNITIHATWKGQHRRNKATPDIRADFSAIPMAKGMGEVSQISAASLSLEEGGAIQANTASDRVTGWYDKRQGG